MANRTSFIATGDAFMTRRLPEDGYEGFEELLDVILSHDVRFNNLEFTAHDKEGYPAAFSGGTWAMSEPEILDSLNAFGFNLYNTANNHSLDYSHGGVLATIRHLKERDMLFAGTGENLSAASAPTYLDTYNARVALIATCSTFHDSDIAGNQSPDLPGRPGLNGLRYNTVYHVEKPYFDTLRQIADTTAMNVSMERSIATGYSQPLPEGYLHFGKMRFKLDTVTEKHTEPDKRDLERIEKSIREARRQADYVLVSVHSHEYPMRDTTEPAEFYHTFCHACIDAGADAILGHGPHELRGIEIYNGKPIFYSLGNFIFQTETVSLQPADAYENAHMAHDTKVGEYMDKRSMDGTRGYCVDENIWRSCMASFLAEDGRITEITLYPYTLAAGTVRRHTGFPRLLKEEDHNDVLEYLAKLSKPFGTEIVIENGVGRIRL